ncbi:MAG: lysozyme inhibitor LprI family protein [Paracoccaceae bacterium]
MKILKTVLVLCLWAPVAFAQDAQQGEMAKECEGSALDEIAAIKCYDAEYELWDKWLNIAYDKALEQARKNDVRIDLAAGSRTATEAMTNMQRAWIDYRDALCEGKSSGTPTSNAHAMAWSQCALYETARQTKVLNGFAEGF